MNLSMAFYPEQASPAEEDQKGFKRALDGWREQDLNRWIKNLHGRISYLNVHGTVMPYYLPDHRHKNEAYLGSLINQYVTYGLEEWEEKRGKSWWISPLKKGAINLFRSLQLDRTIHLDMNLLATSFHSSHSIADYWEALSYLRKRYPKHALVIRGLSQPAFIESLESLGFWRLTNRKVYQVDLNQGFPKKKRPLQQDRKHWEKQTRYHWRPLDWNSEAEIERVLDLYRAIYIEKHSRLNPHYTLAFVRKALESNWLQGEVLADTRNRPVAVQLYLIQNRNITTPFIGYDVTLPRKERLYAYLNLRLMEKAKQSGYLLHMSSGAGTFKKQRGGVGQLEYLLVWDQHLPFYRRIPWKLLSHFTEKYARPYLEQNDV